MLYFQTFWRHYHSPFSLVTGVITMNDRINILIPETETKYPPVVEKDFFLITLVL